MSKYDEIFNSFSDIMQEAVPQQLDLSFMDNMTGPELAQYMQQLQGKNPEQYNQIMSAFQQQPQTAVPPAAGAEGQEVASGIPPAEGDPNNPVTPETAETPATATTKVDPTKVIASKKIGDLTGHYVKKGPQVKKPSSGLFASVINHYKNNILEEAPMPPPPAPAPAPMPPPAGDPAAMGAPPMPPQDQGPTPEEIADELEKESDKSWAHLASILAHAMKYNWSPDELDQIDSSLPGEISLDGLIKLTNTEDLSDEIKDEYDANVISSSIKLFDEVEKTMKKNNLSEVVPADQR